MYVGVMKTFFFLFNEEIIKINLKLSRYRIQIQYRVVCIPVSYGIYSHVARDT